ncbi:MAG TPA: hypothetical protein VIT91_11100 [Chthoniobacterales bacterium]
MNNPAEESTDEPEPLPVLHPQPELDSEQFERLVQIYTSFGLSRGKASAAAQADYLNSNIVAFRRRNTMQGDWFLFKAA